MKRVLTLLAAIFFAMNSFIRVYAGDLRNQFLTNKSVIYVINIRSFNSCDSDKNGIIDIEKGEKQGTFLNAVGRLDELKDKGINTVHVLPVTKVGKKFAQGTAGSLYAMSSFTQFDRLLDEQLNDLTIEEEAQVFISECHKRGISVIFDMPACGSYDLFETNPELFVKDSEGKPVTPLDWTDVRLFKVLDENGQLYMPVYEAYQSYVDLLLSLGVDGIRADVATNKPYEFWQKLIAHARSKNPNFLFLAEASEGWCDPIDKAAVFTPYDKLLEAGFDGYLGSFFNLKKFGAFDLPTYMDVTLKKLKTYKTPKTVIGGFATHDEKSPLLTGGENFARQILWLNATLPLNPYFLDGFDINDRYIYGYFNKKAEETFTDCPKYFVRQGQLDIFNLAAKPHGFEKDFPQEFKNALAFRQKYIDIITGGEFIPVALTNKSVFAYILKTKSGAILVVASKDTRYGQNFDVNLKKIQKFKNIHCATSKETLPEVKKGIAKFCLKPLEIKVFVFE